MPRKADKKEPRACECGCGAMTNGSRFLIGHDAKLKSTLVAAAVEGDKEAERRLKRLGWMKFLTRRRQILAEKTAKEKS